MAKIARENRNDSDAVLDYKDGTLHIVDPFFAFHLFHGHWPLTGVPEPQVQDEERR
jgi:hypothetical protein